MSIKKGMFLIKKTALFKNFSYEVGCIVPETYNDQILMVLRNQLKVNSLIKINLLFLMKLFQYYLLNQ